jgi:hypothetical protein
MASHSTQVRRSGQPRQVHQHQHTCTVRRDPERCPAARIGALALTSIHCHSYMCCQQQQQCAGRGQVSKRQGWSASKCAAPAARERNLQRKSAMLFQVY